MIHSLTFQGGTTVDLIELYDKQSALDEMVEARIIKIDPAFDMFSTKNIEKKIFAFRVELGELANEVGFFKYWKQSHIMDRREVMEEWADCLHFLLSIGLSLGFDSYVTSATSSVKPIEHMETASYLFYTMMTQPLETSTDYATAVSLLITIGHSLGFDDTQLTEAYNRKNEKNIDRQKNGY